MQDSYDATDMEDDETLSLLLQLKELRCARLQALITLKQAKLEEAKEREYYAATASPL